MSASYWIAKYVEDPFKNETRNIGVIVKMNEFIFSRFVGDRNDGSFDARKIKSFSHPHIYSQWREYWKKSINPQTIDKITANKTVNYYLVEGGEVQDTANDSIFEVTIFLYRLLVGGGAREAFEWEEAEYPEIELGLDIENAFLSAEILNKNSQLFSSHPIVRGQSIKGRQVTHKPSFSQKNGVLHIIEHIDMSTTKINKIKERSGWIAYMFKDIKDNFPDTKAYSIVRSSSGDGGEQIEYAKSVLSSESKIVNWMDETERNKFILDRKIIAGVAPSTLTIN
jgi:hypothetical protein